MTISGKTSALSILVTALAAYVGLVLFGADNGPRGADQFWYLADIAALLDGRGAHSSLVFPYTLLTEGFNGPRPFVHNIFYPYASALPAAFVGPFAGAITVNIVSHLIAAIVLYVIAARLSKDPLFSALIAAIYILFPLNAWISMNALAESTTVPFIALMGLATIFVERRLWPWFACAVLIGVLIFVRPSVAVFAVLLPFAYLASNWPANAKHFATGGAIFAVIIGFYWFWGSFFESNVNCPIMDRLNIKIPGMTSNMYCLYRLPDEPVMIFGWIKKVIHNLKMQFGIQNVYSVLFFLPINVFLAASAFLAYKADDPRIRRIGWLSLGFGVVQLATLALTQNQFRYLIIQVPIGILAAGLLLASPVAGMLHRYRYHIAVFSVLAFCVIDFQFALRARGDASELAPDLRALSVAVQENVGARDRVMLEVTEDTEGIAVGIQVGYVFDPRPTLMLPDSYDSEVYDRLVETFEPDVVVLRSNSRLHEILNDRLAKSPVKLSGPYSDYSIYRFGQRALN